jgi:hypothetical protein
MCQKCGTSCGGNKRFCGAVDQVLVPGPQGIQGQDGNDGAVGIQGPPGVSGGLQFEHWFTNPLDTIWINPITVQPEFNYTIGADGVYQIHINLRTFLGGNGFATSGEMRLYINNLVVDQLQIAYPNLGVYPPGETIYQDNVLFWRGTILTGQNIEVKHNSLGSSLIGSVHGNMLVNKE